MKKFLVLSLFLFFYGQVWSQTDFLVVYKSGETKRYYYHVGDYIQLKPLDDFPAKKGFITAFSDSAIYFSQDDSLLLSEVDYIFLGNKKGVFPENLWMYNLLSTSVIALFYEAPFLINGETSPHFKNTLGVIGVITVVPLVTNEVIKLFRRDKLCFRPDQWQAAVVSPGKN